MRQMPPIPHPRRDETLGVRRAALGIRLIERLAQNFQDMAAELGPCIQEEHAMVGQRHLARQRWGDGGTIRARGPPIRPGLVPAMVKRLASQCMRRSEGSWRDQFRLAP